MICHFPAASPEERAVLAAFLREAVKTRAGTDLATMKPAPHDAASDAGAGAAGCRAVDRRAWICRRSAGRFSIRMNASRSQSWRAAEPISL